MNEIIEFFTQNKDMIFIVVLMVFVGVEVIGKVPAVLHTPLIIVMLNSEPTNYLAMGLGFIAVFLGTLNVVGGFVVTDRMLEMFKKKK
jgi:NAD(P) transhydrogenase subunit alpha